MRILRYLAIAPASILGLVIAYLIWLIAINLILSFFNSINIHEFHGQWLAIFQQVIFSASSTILTMGFAVFVAPDHKFEVARIIYIVGLVAVIGVAISTNSFFYGLLSAVILGAIMLWIVYIQAKANKTLQPNAFSGV
jgi:hypothetical protein